MSEVLSVPGLERVAVSNGKVISAKAVPPSSVLVTGLSRGTAQLTLMTATGSKSYLVTVISGRALRQESLNRDSVVRVYIEFLELNEGFGSSTGIRWPELIRFGGMSSVQGNLATTGLNYEASFQTAKGLFQHLVHEGWAKVLANPELYVRLGEEAVFHSGGEFPIASSSESYGRTQHHVEWKKYGLTTKVRPESGDQVHIHSDINIEISEPNAALGNDSIPSLTRRNLVTKIDSIDGETVVLSGLVRHASHRRVEGLPLLSSIPLIGGLFRSTVEADEATELLMAVTFSITTKSRELEKREKFERRFNGTGLQ